MNIPEIGSLPLVKYPNGTILKDESGNLWLMRMGEKRLIPDKTTFEALGFKEDKIISVNSSSLQEIPEDEAIPVIKYPNQTLLRSQDGKVYMINLGIKREIVNKDILEDIILNQMGISASNFTVENFLSKMGFPEGTVIKDKIWKQMSREEQKEQYRSRTKEEYYKWHNYYNEWYRKIVRDEKLVDAYYIIKNGKKEMVTDSNITNQISSDNLPEGTIIKQKEWKQVESNEQYDRIITERHSNQHGEGWKKEICEKLIDAYYIIENGKKQLLNEEKTLLLATKKVSDSELASIEEGSPIGLRPRLVKGSGDSLWLVSDGTKRYFPSGSVTLQAYGYNTSDIQTLPDTELEKIPTDNGVARINYYSQNVQKINRLTQFISNIISFIPGVGQLYSLISSFMGIDMITGQELSKANRWLGFLGGFGGLSGVKGVDLGKGKIASLSRNINIVVNYTNAFRNSYIAVSGDDPFTKEREHINGASRFVAGINALNSYGKPGIGKLNAGQLSYLISGYQIATAISGKEGIFFGKELTEDERWSLGISGASPFIYEGLKAGFNYIKDYKLNQAYKAYNKGNLNPADLTLQQLVGLENKVANDGNKENDAGLEGIDKEIAKRSSNRELASAIASLKNLKTQGVLNEAGELLLKALERERDGRLTEAYNILIVPQFADIGSNQGTSEASKDLLYSEGAKEKALRDALELGGGKIETDGITWTLTIQEPDISTTKWDITNSIKHMTTRSGLEYSIKNAVNWIYNNIFLNLPPSPFSFSIGENVIGFVTGNPKDAREYVDMEGLIKEQARKYYENWSPDVYSGNDINLDPNDPSKSQAAKQALDKAIKEYINMFGDHRTIIAPNYLKFEFKLECVNYEWKAYIRPTEKVPIYIVK
ncbi:MAG: pre-toxin TG domain-containing protein [bacterium]